MPLNISFILKGEMAMRSQNSHCYYYPYYFSYLFSHKFYYSKSRISRFTKAKSKIVGYFPSWGVYGRNYQVADIDASKLTHLNYAFADICWNGKHGNPSTHPDNPNKQTWNCKESGVPLQNKEVPNGTLVLGEPWADVTKSYPGSGTTWEDCDKYARCGNFGELKRLKAKYPHLKTIISVGGWTWSNRFSDMAADEKQEKYLLNLQ